MNRIKIIFIGLLFSCGFVHAQTPEEIDNANFEILKNLELFELVYKNVDLYYVDQPNAGQLMRVGIEAMLFELDPYTNYIPESDIEEYKLMTTGQYGGIGAIIRLVNDKVTIIEPYEGWPAEKAGLLAGDVFLEIDGQNVEKLSSTEVSEKLKGQPGKELTVKVKRGDEIKTVKLIREEVKINSVPYYGMIDDKIGYIKLTSFTQTCAKEVLDAFMDLKKNKGMEKFIFDLRGNPGGLLLQSTQIVNYFIDKGQEIVSIKGRYDEDNNTYYALTNPVDRKMPIVVLIDEGSASASEIVSGSLQDLDRAVIIGQTSYGKGLVQRPLDLKYNAKIKVTIAKYYTPSGRCIQKLDYSTKKIGETAGQFSDSLIHTFSTKNGRKVIDGRGVEPDIKIDLKDYSRLTITLVLNNIIFNYATEFRRKHESISDARSFKITDEIYTDFQKYVLSQDFEYSTQSGEIMKDLEKKAKEEGYYEDSKAEFDLLFEKYKPSKERDLVKFKTEISDILADEIIGRYYHFKGRLEYDLANNESILEAIKILNNPNRYNEILNIQN